MFNNLIAKEGQNKVFYLFLAFVLFFILDCEVLAFIFFVLTLGFAFIYRNKKLQKDYDISDILAPISGEIVTIDKRDNKTQIIIEVSLCDNHILRAPKNGNFTLIHQKGLHTLLDSLKAKKLNEKAIIKYSDMSIELISSLFGTDISITSKEAFMGDKLGVFLDGQVIVELDNSKEILVNIGNKVEAGKSVLARAK